MKAGKNFEIIYLANCGLYIESEGTSVLVDALFSKDTPFDSLEPIVEHNIINAAGKFSHIDGILFTHTHPDHFDAGKVSSFMEKHSETKLLMPSDEESGRMEAFTEQVPEDRLTLMEGEFWQRKTINIGSLKVSYFKTGHISYDYSQHYCFLIENNDKAILVTGDTELAEFSRMGELSNLNNCTAFFNPIVLGKLDWVKNIAGLKILHMYIYHIPSEKKDSHGYRKMAVKNAERAEAYLPDCQLLLHSMQSIVV